MQQSVTVHKSLLGAYMGNVKINEVVELLRDAAEERKLSQRAIAKKTGLQSQTVNQTFNQTFNGLRENLDTVTQIAEVLGYRVELVVIPKDGPVPVDVPVHVAHLVNAARHLSPEEVALLTTLVNGLPDAPSGFLHGVTAALPALQARARA